MRPGVVGAALLVAALLPSACCWGDVTIEQPRANALVGQFVDVAAQTSPSRTVAVSYALTRVGGETPVYEAPPVLLDADKQGRVKLRLVLPVLDNREGLVCSIRARERAAAEEDATQVTVALRAAPGEDGDLDPAIPIVTSPTEGSAVGPASEVEGRAKPGQLVVISTKCYNAETGEFIKDVPGIRHYPNEDGTFHFRVATPRVAMGEKAPVRYEMRVYSIAPNYRSPAVYIHLREPE